MPPAPAAPASRSPGGHPPPPVDHQEEDEQQAYAAALARLAQLQSNRAVTSLFTNPLTPPAPAADLNAPAIPEMLAWLRRAGYPPAALAASPLRVVHVAGTKGKGSVAAMVASILGQYFPPSSPDGGGGSPGVGLYTSPHVVSVRERVALGGRPLGRGEFARCVDELWERFTRAAREEAAAAAAAGQVDEAELDGPRTKPFFFRFLTILALHAFARAGCRHAVVECGIGGEHDATNVLPPAVVTAAVVTQLGVDHVGMLGATREEIAWHKSGVFKPGVKAFTRRLREDGGVMEVLRARAREKGATLVEVADEEVDGWEGVSGARLRGPFQKRNMALAAHAAREHLLRTGTRFEGRFGTDGWTLGDMPAEFVRGLREAALRGRCEVLEDADGVLWHLDGAHTDDSLAGIGRWFAEQCRGGSGSGSGSGGLRVLVFNQQDRDPAVLLKALLAGAQRDAGTGPAFTHAVFTRNEEQRPVVVDEEEGGEHRDLSVQTRAQETMRGVDKATQTAVYDAVQPAVEHVRELAAQARRDGKQCKVLVTGSFHLVGAVLKIIDDHVEF